MRVALISDIHGNEIALEAVLAAIDRAGVDRIVCLGDVATLGPRPVAVLERLRSLDCPVILGNHDDFLLRPRLIQRYTEAAEVVAAVAWCHERLAEEHFAFLRTFQPHAEIPLGRGRTMLAYHGSPRSHMEDILVTTPPQALDAMFDSMFDGRRYDVLAGGHTHLQMLRQHDGAMLVNPGSVGLPFRSHAGGGPPELMTHAAYAIVDAFDDELAVELRRVRLDPGALRAAIEGTGHPLAAYHVQQYSQFG